MRGTLDVLAAVLPSALFSDPLLPILLTSRLVSLSIEHGTCAASAYGCAMLAMKVGSQFGDYPSGYRLGTVALELVDRPGFGRFKPTVYLMYGFHIRPWSHGLDGCLDLLMRGFEAAEATGDVTYAVYILNAVDSLMLTQGAPLTDAERASRRALEYARSVHYDFVAALVNVKLRFARMMMGDASTFGSLSGEDFDEADFERTYTGLSVMALPLGWYWIRRLQAHVFAHDAVAALVAAVNAAPHTWVSTSFLEFAEFHFYGALARAQCHDSADDGARPGLRADLAANLEQLATWATHSPDALGSRHLLAAAEVARIDGRERQAMDLYEQAIELARRQQSFHIEALAFELAARFYASRGFERIASNYRREARACYLRWGAHGKVRQLEELHPELRDVPDVLSSTGIYAPIDQLDVATIVKASQALSSEIALDRLSETLMRLAVESAGAERGRLISVRGEQLRVEADASTGSAGVVVHVRAHPVDGTELPATIINYVVRTHHKVVIGNTSSSHAFSTDGFFDGGRSGSLLCLPLVRQTQVVGLLFLENRLTSDAFTPARTELLELLASQAAIALENARLYADLASSQAELSHVMRVTTLGELAASIAHEVNQPLTSIVADASACLNWLRGESPNVSAIQKSITAIANDANRAGQILSRIRSLLSRSTIDRAECDLFEIIAGVLPLVQAEVTRAAVQLETALDRDVPPVFGDFVQLQQVVLDLILNAVEASRGVQPSRRSVLVRAHAESRAGQRWARVDVVDTGVGFGSGDPAQLFERSTRRNPRDLAWGCPSVARSSSGTAASCQQRAMTLAEPPSASRFQGARWTDLNKPAIASLPAVRYPRHRG